MTPAKAPRRAGIYCRISSDPNGTALGVARQEKDTRALAASKGWEVIDTYIDNDVSASSYGKKRRVQYERMLADIESGRINAVAVWALDRLYRKPIDLERLIPLVEGKHVAMATVGGDHDLSTRGGLLHARIMGAVAADESRAKSDRQKNSNVQRREMGKSHGGARAYGFVSNGTMEPAPAEIAVVQELFARFNGGSSLRELVRDLNDRAVPTVRGGKWIDSTVRAVLMNARYVGLIEHAGEMVPGSWEPVVSEDIWRAARATLTDPARRTSPGSGRKYLLSGVLTCGVCHGVVYGRPTSMKGPGKASTKGRHTYFCKPGTCVTRDLARVDAYVFSAVVKRLAHPDAAELLTVEQRGDADRLRVEADALRARQDDLAALVAEPGGMTVQQFKVANARLTERLAQVEGQLAEGGRTNILSTVIAPGDADAVAARWKGMSLTQHKAIVRALTQRIAMVPVGAGAHHHGAVGVDITWRHELAED